MSLLADWARVLLGSLADAGVRDVVLSPGSRSTPLVWAAATEPRLRCLDVIDERAAAFVALGQARVTGLPSVLLCTSGTAAAHYLPAVAEASEARLPLIVLSADRPFELHGAGANQTLDQTRLFGAHARRFVDLPTPETREPSLRALRRVAAQAVTWSLGPTPGPVHLNARLRKPLEPDPESAPSPEAARVLGSPLPRVFPPAAGPSSEGIAALAEACRRAERPVLVAGPAPAAQAEARSAVEALARRLGAPLLAEATSQLRLGPRDPEVVALDRFDVLLRSERGRTLLDADLVLQLGRSPVSGAYERWVGARPIERWVLGPDGWDDPTGTARGFVRGGVAETVGALGRALEGAPGGAGRAAWADRARALEEAARGAADTVLEGGAPFSEAAVARAVVTAVPAGGWLAVGNSLSVRQLDVWVPGGGPPVRVLSQRGVSGIDGLVAGAAGAARASGEPTFLLLGDVSFAHDVGGLATARGLASPLVVVVVDNGGGRIFEQLPVADALPELMPHFLTPPDLDVEAAARAFGHRFARAEDPVGLTEALRDGAAEGGCTVVEARVSAQGARQLVGRLQAAVEGALEARFS